MASYKLNSIDVTVEGVTKTFAFGEDGPDLGDHDDEFEAQKAAYDYVVENLETTETIVEEAETAKSYEVSITITRTQSASFSVTVAAEDEDAAQEYAEMHGEDWAESQLMSGDWDTTDAEVEVEVGGEYSDDPDDAEYDAR